MDRFFETIINMTVGAGIYLFGAHQGEKQARKDIEVQLQQAEINELRKQLNELKNRKN
jgi:hypothetical protein